MKFITAIIQPHELEAVQRELETVEVNLMTVTSVVGQKHQKDIHAICQGADKVSCLLNKIRLDITINEDFVEPTIAAIIKGAHIDGASEGRIFVD